MNCEQLTETYHHYNAMTFPRFADNTLHVCDWLELMQALPDDSVDMILTDMPYGTTACAWDTVIDLAAWWVECKRVMKPRGAVVCTASQPFTSRLVSSNYEWFRYEWVWEKTVKLGFLDAKQKPLKAHENVIVFSNQTSNYFPQMESGIPYIKIDKTTSRNFKWRGAVNPMPPRINHGTRYPTSVLKVANGNNFSKHPTQKPVPLFEYLIKTYTHPGDLVVDPFVGSGTTAVAAKGTGRRFICGDQSEEYIDIARKWVFPTFGEPPKRKREEQPLSDLPLFAALEQGA